MAIKLAEYAKVNGISYITAWRAFKNGKLQNAKQLPSGILACKTTKSKGTIVVARKSSILLLLSKIQTISLKTLLSAPRIVAPLYSGSASPSAPA